MIAAQFVVGHGADVLLAHPQRLAQAA
jgi:hypothetical protein